VNDTLHEVKADNQNHWRYVDAANGRYNTLNWSHNWVNQAVEGAERLISAIDIWKPRCQAPDNNCHTKQAENAV
jgi:hypothetical protein